MAGNKQNALEVYKKSGTWRETFAIAQELKYSSDDLSLLAKELSGIYIYFFFKKVL
jgi:hypothetical protein